MPRKAWEPTDQERDYVRSMAEIGLPQDDIASVIKVAPKTLRLHCRQELDEGAAHGKNAILKRLHAIALKGSTKEAITALIFIAKTRCGFRETNIQELKVQELPAIKTNVRIPDRLKDAFTKD